MATEPESAAQQSPADTELDSAATATPEPDTLPVEAAPKKAPAGAANTDILGAPSPTAAKIDEIVITSQQHEENIRDVPISIQAFSGETLGARGIENTRELSQAVPSLEFISIAGFSLIFIRGLGNQIFIPSADPSIATYIDGIYVPNGEATAQSLSNIERVEVLKGPQGTLFGRNAPGGAISVVTAEPGNEFKGSLEGQLGNFNARSAQANVSGPITSWLSASVSGELSRKDAYYTDLDYKPEPDHLGAIRLKLLVHPTDHLSLGLTGYHSSQSGIFFNIHKNTDPSLLGRALGIQPEQDNYFGQSDFPTSTKGTQDLAYGNLGWKLPWFDLKLLGSDQRQVSSAQGDFDGSPLPLAALSTSNAFTDLQTGELQLLSNPGSWGHNRFKWVAGLYYLQSSTGLDPGVLRLFPAVVSGLLSQPQQPALAQLGDQLQNLFNAFGLQGTPLGNGGLGLEFHGILGTRSYSAYAQGTYTFSDWLDLTIGGRFQRDKRFLRKAQTELSDFNGNGSISLLSFELNSANASNFSPKAVLNMRPSDQTLLYLSYSVAYQSGTYNIVNVYKEPNYIVPEKLTAFELGSKLELLGGRLRLDAALFDYEIRNLQSGFASLASGGIVQFFSIPHARSRGAEIEADWLPIPTWDPGLTLALSTAYLDAVYTDFPQGPGYAPGTGLYSDDLDFSGNRLTYSPKISGNLGAVQIFPGARGVYAIAIDDYYNSGVFTTAQNNVTLPPFALLNARVGYLDTPWNLRVTLFGQNLLSRRYDVLAIPIDFGTNRTLGAPREFGVRLNWGF